jgi:undecaprenyl-diphosphatase
VTTFEAVVLGLLQGLTEFLPVSSSGHLVIGATVLGVPVPGVVFEVFLHVATLLAVVIVYRRKIAELIVGGVRREPTSLRYIGFLILATIPAGLVGIFLKESVEVAFDTPAVTGYMLLVTGALLLSTRLVREDRGALEITLGIALLMGFAQAFAILPGISRSGTTIVAGIWAGTRGDKAAEFAFLMSIPAIGGAALLELGGLAGMGIGLGPLLAGFLVALVSGIAAIVTLIWLLRRRAFYLFTFYVWPVALLFLFYLYRG